MVSNYCITVSRYQRSRELQFSHTSMVHKIWEGSALSRYVVFTIILFSIVEKLMLQVWNTKNASNILPVLQVWNTNWSWCVPLGMGFQRHGRNSSGITKYGSIGMHSILKKRGFDWVPRSQRLNVRRHGCANIVPPPLRRRLIYGVALRYDI